MGDLRINKLIISFFIFLFSIGFVFAIDIDSCVNLTQDGKIYVLNQSINGFQTTGRCIDIQADNIILDCNGFEINASGAIAIYAEGVKNITIKNCDLVDSGIQLRDVNDSNVQNNSVVGAPGIYMYGSKNIIVDCNNKRIDGTGISARGHGIFLESTASQGTTEQVTVENCEIVNYNFDTHCYGISSSRSNSDNHIFRKNKFSNNYVGLFIHYSSNVTISSNNICSNLGQGIYLNSPQNIVENNSICSNQNGIFIASSGKNNILEKNTITNNTKIGIVFKTHSSNNLLVDNIVSNNGDWGILSEYQYNEAINLTLGDVNMDYKGKCFMIRPLDSPGTRPDEQIDLNKFIFVEQSNPSCTPDLSFSIPYTDPDWVDIIEHESYFSIWKHDGVAWIQLSSSGANTINKTIFSGKITEFSIFAPMGLKLEKPQYKNISTFPPEKTVYNKHEEFQFNITWNDNVNLSKVLFFFNGIEHIPTCLPDFPVNKTHCTITLYNLTYGNHHYSWWANDTNGHENSTGGISYVLYEKEPKTSTAPTSLIGTLINSVLITLDLEKITMNSDETEKIQITLFNDGNTYLGNLELSAEGLPEASYLFSDNSTSLDANQSATIYMDIIPESLEGDYEIEIIVNNSATKSSAILQLTVNKILSERELQHETKETQPLFQEIETQTEDGAITGLFISPLENTPTTQLVIAGIAVAILLAFLFKNKIIGLFLR